MPIITFNDNWASGPVRIRAKANDPLEGLKAHAYIAARNLQTPAERIETDAYVAIPLFLRKSTNKAKESPQ